MKLTLIRTKKAQTVLEYTVLIIIIIAAFMTMQAYLKRGFQGRWKQAVDDFGDQYDPRFVDLNITHKVSSPHGISTVRVLPTDDGNVTIRYDDSTTIDQKHGTIRVGWEKALGGTGNVGIGTN